MGLEYIPTCWDDTWMGLDYIPTCWEATWLGLDHIVTCSDTIVLHWVPYMHADMRLGAMVAF